MRRNVNIRTMEFDNAGLSVCVPESLWRFKGLLTATRCKRRPEMAKIRMHQTSEGKYSQSSPQCRMEKWRVGHDGHRWMCMPAQDAISIMVITDCIHTLQLDSTRYPQGTLLCTIRPMQNPPMDVPQWQPCKVADEGPQASLSHSPGGAPQLPNWKPLCLLLSF